MTKFEKIQKFANENLHLGLAALQKAIEEKFNVGVYLDAATDFAPRPRHTQTHGLEIWFKRNGNWVTSAGWIHINKDLISK